MKRILFIAALVAAIGVAQAQETSTVHFVRKKMPLGVLGNLNFFVDGQMICEVDNNTYTTHQLPAGKHTFTVQYSGKSAKDKANERAVEIDLKAGETYTLKAIIEKTFTTSKLMLEEVTKSTWDKDRKDLNQAQCQ